MAHMTAEAKLGAEVLGYPPTRVFWQKRLQALENKGNECRKERKETTKRLQTAENMGFATEAQRHEAQYRVEVFGKGAREAAATSRRR